MKPSPIPDISVLLYVRIVFAVCVFDLFGSFHKHIDCGNQNLPCIACHLSICIAFLLFHKLQLY